MDVMRVALLCAAAFAAVRTPSPGAPADRLVPALWATVATGKAAYAAGEPIYVTIEVRNESAAEARYPASDPVATFDMTVRDAAGNVVQPVERTGRPIIAPHHPLIVPAGTAVAARNVRDGSTRLALSEWGYRLPRGTYRIETASRMPVVGIRSGPISITIG